MATAKNKPEQQPESESAGQSQPVPAGQAEQEAARLAAPLQKAMDEAQDRGLLGVEVDPTPNHAYTAGGVAAGEPTPETDAEHAREVRQRLDDDARQR